jgi:hypothetical protein
MRTLVMALMVCGMVGAVVAFGSSGQSQAAMPMGAQKNMSVIEQAKKKSARRYSCWDFFCTRCCTDQVTGEESCRPICM